MLQIFVLCVCLSPSPLSQDWFQLYTLLNIERCYKSFSFSTISICCWNSDNKCKFISVMRISQWVPLINFKQKMLLADLAPCAQTGYIQKEIMLREENLPAPLQIFQGRVNSWISTCFKYLSCVYISPPPSILWFWHEFSSSELRINEKLNLCNKVIQITKDSCFVRLHAKTCQDYISVMKIWWKMSG